MTRFGQKAALTLLLCLFAGVVLSLSAGLGRVARMVPLAVAVPTLLLLIGQLCMDLVPRLAAGLERWEKRDLFRVEPLRERSLGRLGTDESGEPIPRARRERIALLWLSVLGCLVFLFGFLAGLPAHILLYWKMRLQARWVPSALAAAGMWILLYLLLVQLLEFPLYRGHLWDRLSGTLR